jgi:hypothetical protein
LVLVHAEGIVDAAIFRGSELNKPYIAGAGISERIEFAGPREYRAAWVRKALPRRAIGRGRGAISPQQACAGMGPVAPKRQARPGVGQNSYQQRREDGPH